MSMLGDIATEGTCRQFEKALLIAKDADPLIFEWVKNNIYPIYKEQLECSFAEVNEEIGEMYDS